VDEIGVGFMTNDLDRFKAPDLSEEPRVICANCGDVRYYDEMDYDELMEQYYCDRRCFNDWHDENFEVVGDYYYDMNVKV